MKSRTDLVNYAKEHNIPVTVTKAKPYSCDGNLLHLSFEGGELEDPWEEGGPYTYSMAVPPEEAPNEPQVIMIDFEKGDPVGLNGKPMSPGKLIAELNRLGGKHGIGRMDMVENRFVGMKSRGVYETPGGTILHAARRDLESLCIV